MEQKQNKYQPQEPALCLNCKSFYANPDFNQMCSMCYKDTAKSAVAKPSEQGVSISAPTEPAPVVLEGVPAPVVPTQADKSKCWSCQKKAGPLGFACKCGFVFCKSHRLPENHKCGFDFALEGKRQLEKLNPVVKTDKLEKF